MFVLIQNVIKSYINEFQTLFGVVYWRGEEYRMGSFVFLAPTAFKFKTSSSVASTNTLSNLKKKVEKVCIIAITFIIFVSILIMQHLF